MSDYSPFDVRAPSPQDVNLFHQNSDKDTSPFSLHHTLGTKPNQAMPGDHAYSKEESDTKYLANTGPADNWAPNVRNFNDSALAHALELAKFKVVDDVCQWWLNVTISAAGVNYVKFDLPAPINIANQQYIGNGRENSIGNMCQVIRHAPTAAAVLLYNNGNTAVNGYVLILSGSYLTNVTP